MPKKQSTTKSNEQGSKSIWTTFTVIIVTAVIAGGAVSLLQKSALSEQISELKYSKSSNHAQIESLQEQITQLQKDKDKIAAQMSTEITPSKNPKAGWEKYFPGPQETTLTNKTLTDVQALLGVPQILIRQINKELWIFQPYNDDSTGLYLYFKNSKLLKSKLDEFTGLDISLMDDAYWQ